jgi:hypothetical protein
MVNYNPLSPLFACLGVKPFHPISFHAIVFSTWEHHFPILFAQVRWIYEYYKPGWRIRIEIQETFPRTMKHEQHIIKECCVVPAFQKRGIIKNGVFNIAICPSILLLTNLDMEDSLSASSDAIPDHSQLYQRSANLFNFVNHIETARLVSSGTTFPLF